MNQLINSIQIVKLCPNGENELIRILFEGLGKKVYFPRKGDNSERFDAIVDFDNYKSVVEIEIPSTEILDAPRNLLDDYAVQKQRKKEKDKPIVPLVICWDLPNKRTDYWNVIKDINSILKIKIKTISILALALHYWTETPLDLESDDYYLEYSKCHMNSESEIFQKANISIEDYPGYFTPYK
nr:MAG TPA: hypothetical protein [Caudoviricetes sp.]